MNDGRRDERMLRAVVVFASVAMLALLLLPASAATPDEAKYIGLGLNILDGRGLITVFGVPFPNHSPIWPLLLTIPQRYLGIDALAVGHVLNAVAAAATVAFTGLLGWRVRPAAGALAALMMLAFPFLASNARTAGLDLPATAVTLAFLVVAVRALDLGSVPLALAAGALFGLAFLVKETALPFFPVPFLAALLAPTQVRRIARLAAAAMVAAAITVSWWFVLHANLEGTVYRLGTPAWTLAPIAVALVVLAAVGWNADALARRTARWRRGRVVQVGSERWRAALAWGGLGAWTLGQLFVYARTPKLAGQSLFRVSQWVADIDVYLPRVAVVAGFGLAGVLVALLLVRRAQAVRELLFASVAGLPLILLVLAIGETPRHYLANIAVLVALAAAGWIHGLDGARRDRRWAVAMTLALGVAVFLPLRLSTTPVRVAILVAVVLGIAALWVLARATFGGEQTQASQAASAPVPRAFRRSPRREYGVAILALAALVIFVTAASVKRLEGDRVRERAVEAVSAWIETHVKPGDTVALSPLLAYEIAIEIRDRHRPLRIRPGVAVVDATAPIGLRWYGKRLVEKPLAIDTALRNVDQLDVYGAELLDPLLDEQRPTVWIDAAFLTPSTEPTSTSAMLAAAAGFTTEEAWRFPLNDEDLVVTAWSVDPDRAAFDESTIFADVPTVQALIRLFEAEGGGMPAAVLADRIEVVPHDSGAGALLDTLRALGAGTAGGSSRPSPVPSLAAP